MPKYFTTPRTIPIMDEEGKRCYMKINQEEGMDMEFDTNALNVVVKAGASFTVQKNRALMMAKEMMQMSPVLQEFFAGEKGGLNFILDNMEGKGLEMLKEQIDQFIDKREQMRQLEMERMKNEAQNSPQVMKQQLDMAKLQHDSQKLKQEGELESHKLEIDLMDADLRHQAQIAKTEAEKYRSNADIAIKEIELRHKRETDTRNAAYSHAKDIAGHRHTVAHALRQHKLAIADHEHQKQVAKKQANKKEARP